MIFSGGGGNKKSPENKIEDLGMTFEEFQSKYNETAISRKYPNRVLHEENLKKYGVYNLCQCAYATMKVEIDSKTKNISSIEVYGEYEKKLPAIEKQALFSEQKQIFEIASEVVGIEDAKYKASIESILNHSLAYWEGDAVTLEISSKIPHVSEHIKSLPSSNSSKSDVSYLVKGFWWMDSNGDLHAIYRKTKIEWTGRSIILSNGDKAYQFEFLEGTYAGDYGYWSKSFQ